MSPAKKNANMKRIVSIVVLTLAFIPLWGQSRSENYYAERDTTSSVDIVYKKILENTYMLDAIEGRLIRLENTTAPRYKLYPTQNMWTFLELDTYFGVISKVQWTLDTKKHERFTRRIGSVNSLDEPHDNYYPGRYELYPTTNIYNFLLLDSRTGNCWQVQWGISGEDDFILPIE